jgi:hypothetical protein
VTDPDVTLAEIGRTVGVGRVAVAAWRRRNDDFPPPVGGTTDSPRFDRVQVDAWLHAHGRLPRQEPSEPRTVALALIRAVALDEAARHANPDVHPPGNWELYHALTAALEGWHAGGTLRENSLLLIEWLAVEALAYFSQVFGGRANMRRWLCEFGDEVCRTQQHEHPAGPTAIEILSIVEQDPNPRPQKPAGADRLVRIAVPYLLYLRADQDLEDAREMALTLGLWAGGQLADLTHYDAERITSYMNARDQRAPQ